MTSLSNDEVEVKVGGQDEVPFEDGNSENGQSEQDDEDGGSQADDEGEDGEKEYEEGDEYETTLEEHLANAEATKIDARETFFSETVGFSFSDENGDYHVRASNKGSSEAKFFEGYEWPQAYVGQEEDINAKERHSVNAAIWFKSVNNDRYELIALWCFTGRYEATTTFYLQDHKPFLNPWFEEQSEFYNQVIPDVECHGNFMSDQDACVTEEFHCPALDFIQIDEMEAIIEASAADQHDQEEEEDEEVNFHLFFFKCLLPFYFILLSLYILK
jgi:hypothetical protein